MSYVEIEDGVFAKEASPDPSATFSTTEFQSLLEQKQREVTMYEQEIVSLTTRKEVIEAEIVEIQALLE